ncbi:MAG: hypothetical protein ACE5D8_06935 [Fidelibacterota bacterium]
MTPKEYFRRIIPGRQKTPRSMAWLAAMIIIVLWLIMYLQRIATAP